ncbi:hypothetical protein GCM10023318_45810 [Nocardia callitridis]|uniref:Conjugal transfer protein n=1 Tax=Nocardia callitridis TaxID=648753 RepID=A0ABP9KSX7_9NOCA
MLAVLAVLSVLGGGHAIFSMFTSDAPPPVDGSATVAIGHAQLVGSFAERFVVTYLGAAAGQQDRLAEFVTVPQVSLPSKGKEVSDPAVIYLSREVSGAGLEVWSATISVTDHAGGTDTGTTRAGASTTHATTGAKSTAKDEQAAERLHEYYRVPVVLAGGRPRAMALPAMVEPPARGEDLGAVYDSPCSSETPLAQVTSGFLTTFLTGTGDVGRYTALGVPIVALRPAPFTGLDGVTVTADDSGCGANGTVAHVLATVNPKTESATAATLVYPLTLVRDGGQWQVQSMDSIPALSQPLSVIANQDPGRGNASSTESAAATTSTALSSAVQIPPATQK